MSIEVKSLHSKKNRRGDLHLIGLVNYTKATYTEQYKFRVRVGTRVYLETIGSTYGALMQFKSAAEDRGYREVDAGRLKTKWPTEYQDLEMQFLLKEISQKDIF